MDTIMQDKKECYFTKAKSGLHKHHIFGSFNRDNSEKYGLWVWLRWDRHIADSPHRTPHNDAGIDLMLKREAQRKFEESHTRDEFMQIFGRSWM